jgi:hypothetical protein
MLQKFINAPFTPGQITPAMQYFNVALTKDKLTRYETLELARAGNSHLAHSITLSMLRPLSSPLARSLHAFICTQC